MKVTFPPARAALTAWLAPLPPGAVRNSPPNNVSPGAGRRLSLMTMSVFELPMTQIRAMQCGNCRVWRSSPRGTSGQFFDRYILVRRFGYGPAMDLHSDDTELRDAIIRFCIIDRLNSIHR